GGLVELAGIGILGRRGGFKNCGIQAFFPMATVRALIFGDKANQATEGIAEGPPEDRAFIRRQGHVAGHTKIESKPGK
ncbi:MAG: hypothetical protein AB1638_10995, partial [Nitrospirota bacterium]